MLRLAYPFGFELAADYAVLSPVSLLEASLLNVTTT